MNEITTKFESDESLVRTLQLGGPPEVFDELVRRHLGKTRGMVFGMVLNHHDADDVVQEVFVRAYKALAKFKTEAKFSTWLYRVAINTSRTFLKKRSRFIPVAIEDLGTDDHAFCGTHPLQHQETFSRIGAALAELSPSLRAAIVLTAIEGHEIAEAAKIEGCTRATMYWRIHQARKILKTSLKEVLEK